MKDRDLSAALTPAFFFRAIKELLKYHREYLEFNKDLQNIIKKKVGDDTNKDEKIDPNSNVEELVKKVTLLRMTMVEAGYSREDF